MDYKHIQDLMNELKGREIPREILDKMEEEFEIEYAYHSVKLSGSSLTYEQVKAIIKAMKKQNGGNE